MGFIPARMAFATVCLGLVLKKMVCFIFERSKILKIKNLLYHPILQTKPLRSRKLV